LAKQIVAPVHSLDRGLFLEKGNSLSSQAGEEARSPLYGIYALFVARNCGVK
jgi:hypothetical protein